MNKLSWVFFWACASCTSLMAPSLVWASQPPPPKTLAERVELATNVIIGTAKKVTVMELKDGKLQEVKPEPKLLAPFGQMAEVEIEVDEVMYPLEWKPKKTVRYFFGGGFFEVESIRGDTVGQKHIYLMKRIDELKNEGELFTPSYGWHLNYSLDQKAQIQTILDARVKRETESKGR